MLKNACIWNRDTKTFTLVKMGLKTFVEGIMFIHDNFPQHFIDNHWSINIVGTNPTVIDNDKIEGEPL